MLLRERQKEFVERSVSALEEYGNTLSVAPTGAGKTICLSAVIGRIIEYSSNTKVCVLAHRDELTYQNINKFGLVNPHITTNLFNAEVKSWEGQVTFAMVQTLSRECHLAQMPKLDLIVIDEAHHITAPSYLSIIKQAKELNPKVKIFGVTATPIRGDKNSLGQVFTNCADQIRLGELFVSGHLVKPKTFISNIEEAREKLQALKVKDSKDYDEAEVASILDTVPVNSEVVRIWQEKASTRKTVVFCSTVQHAKNVTAAFIQAGINAALVTAGNTKDQRDQILNSMVKGKIEVLVNVALLTEGWDFPPISCVILLRQSSYKSTMIQMIGRGLRTVDATIYPDVVKRDCIVLDFGISSILHGSLEQEVELDFKGKRTGYCPKCNKPIPSKTFECPLCTCDLDYLSYEKVVKGQTEIENISMSEIELLDRSNFIWTTLGENIKMVSGFNSWCCVLKQNDIWLTVGGDKRKSLNQADVAVIPTSIIYQGDELCAIAAGNDFLNHYEASAAARGEAKWRELLPTQSQMNSIPLDMQKRALTRGDAAAIISYVYNARTKLIGLGIKEPALT